MHSHDFLEQKLATAKGQYPAAIILSCIDSRVAVAGARLVLVMGHTARGAIDQVQLGRLTGLLGQIRPMVELTHHEGERTTANRAFVDAVAQADVHRTANLVRQRSPLLANLEQKGHIKIAGAMFFVLTAGRAPVPHAFTQ